MNDPLTMISTRHTSQAEQADPRQVPNSAGGWGFKTSREARLHRFLTLGVSGGTYYATERELTKDNAQVVLDWARNDAVGLVARALDVSVRGRAPRNNPALFALAAAAGLGDDAGRKAALSALPHVARTGTHLFIFAGYAENFRGWGRGLRRGIGDWYLGKDEGQLAYQVLKYRNREGWMHQHLLRLAHPEHRPLLAWIAGTPELAAAGRTGTRHSGTAEVPTWRLDALPPLVQAFLAAQAAERDTALSPQARTAVYASLIGTGHGLSWEMLPDEALSLPGVWEALIAAGMPQTALMRQLPRLTRLGVLTQLSPVTAAVCAQLADRERLVKARVHPVNVLVALRTYASGVSVRGGTTWTPVPAVTDALDAAFYAAFGAVEPAGKRTMCALDVSGSMGSSAGGLPISCREATTALALVTAATEPSVLVTGFTSSLSDYGHWPSVGSFRGARHPHMTDNGISPLNISPRQRLDDAIRTVSNLPFGGTDCALPMLWAAQNNVEIDTFEVMTDNETWAGDIHPHQALEAYRQKTGIPARLAVVAMTPTDFSIADPDDPGSMDVSGMDSAVPGLLADFSRGDL